MIDFRYHVVSLISVFLALAVGIALGAGPLKESIGDTLTGQVDQLRSEKDALRIELDAATADLADQRAALAAAAPDLVGGVLPGRRIAVIQVGTVDPSIVDGVTAQLAAAGATVSAQVTVTDQWTDPARASFRASLAGTLVGYLDPAPAADSGTGVELAEALVQALTVSSPTDVDALGENAGVLLDLLGGDAALVTIEGTVTSPADAVVVLAGPLDLATATDAGAQETATESPDPTATVPSPTSSPDEQAVQEEVDAASQIAQAAQARSSGVVVAGGATSDPSVLLALRSDADLASQFSTVDSVDGLAGQMAVPMALSARLIGTIGQYGVGDLATSAMPRRVVLQDIVRVPVGADATPAPPAEG